MSKEALKILNSKIRPWELKALHGNLRPNKNWNGYTLHDILRGGFIWGDSIEKGDYWLEICNRFTEKELNTKIIDKL